MISRRQVLAIAGALPAWLSAKISSQMQGASPIEETHTAVARDAPRMGGTPTAFALRAREARRKGSSFDIIEHCHSLGLGGVQTNPPSAELEEIRPFRRRLEDYGMHLICDPTLPQEQNDVEAFESQVKSFKEAGATALHAAMTGRRYEDFESFEQFRRMFERCRKSVELAEPVLRKHHLRLGIENHKGWRSSEQVAWIKHLGSEWVGVCLDFGNNIALCEEPMDTLRTLAPCTFFAHIKDVAVEEYADGFLLSEVPFGDGLLDLGQMVQILRKIDPRMIFNLEMITRDPLQIPVFTPKYWATFDDAHSPLPGRDLASVLAMVRLNRAKTPLSKIGGLPPGEQVRAEDSNNQRCITYARQHLNL